MVSHIATVAFWGIDVKEVDVQVHISIGMPAFYIVGLPDKAVRESTERVRSSLSSMGLALPAKRITVNLAPADIPKEGSHYDLAIALGLLVEMGILSSDAIDSYIALGELALDGALMRVAGTLPAAIYAISQNRGIICPEANGNEAAWGGDLSILAAPSLQAIIHHLKGVQLLQQPSIAIEESLRKYEDMQDVKGQVIAKRALEIVAAGGHNMLMVGPPGSGKSMLAARLPGLLPPFGFTRNA